MPWQGRQWRAEALKRWEAALWHWLSLRLLVLIVGGLEGSNRSGDDHWKAALEAVVAARQQPEDTATKSRQQRFPWWPCLGQVAIWAQRRCFCILGFHDTAQPEGPEGAPGQQLHH